MALIKEIAIAIAAVRKQHQSVWVAFWCLALTLLLNIFIPLIHWQISQCPYSRLPLLLFTAVFWIFHKCQITVTLQPALSECFAGEFRNSCSACNGGARLFGSQLQKADSSYPVMRTVVGQQLLSWRNWKSKLCFLSSIAQVWDVCWVILLSS